MEEEPVRKTFLSLPSYRPHYQTAEGRRQNIDPYEKKCLELLDKEAKKYPGYNIRMTIKNGIPRFSYLKKSLTRQAVERRIKRTLSGIKQDIKATNPGVHLRQKLIEHLRESRILLGESEMGRTTTRRKAARRWEKVQRQLKQKEIRKAKQPPGTEAAT